MNEIELGNPMDHGRKLTADEYRQALIQLYTRFRGPDGRLDVLGEDLRMAELNLAIDFRFGIDFPVERRQQLWQVQEKLEKRRRVGMMSIAFSMVSAIGRRLRSGMLTKFLFKEYAAVLSPDEMKLFLED